MRATTFTTYVNTEIDPKTVGEFRRLEQIATRSFGSIQDSAVRAARASAGIIGGMGAGINTTRIATANRAVSQTAVDVQRTASLAGKALEHQSAASILAERRMMALSQGLRSTATALQVVQGPLGPLAGRITALSNALEHLTGFRLGIAATGAALFALTSASNKYVEMRSRLTVLYESQEEVNKAFARTVRIASDTKAALEPVVDLYAKLTSVAPDVGLDAAAVERVTRAASLAARIGGGSRQSQEAGLYQLGQGIGSNSLGGDELKSVKENTVRLAKAIAEGLSEMEGFGKVGIGQLKALGAEGKLTADVIAEALSRSLGRLEEEAKRLGPTLSSSMNEFSTNFTAMIGRFDQAVGLTTKLAMGISFAGNNLTELVSLGLGLAAAIAAVKFGPMIADSARAVANIAKMPAAMIETAKVERAAAQTRSQNANKTVREFEAVIQKHRAEKVAIESKIKALESEVTAKRKSAAVNASYSGYGTEGFQRRAVEDARAAAIAEQRLESQRRQLMGVNNALATSTNGLSRAQTTAAGAAAEAATKSNIFKSAGMALLGTINPLGLAVGLLTTALFELAFAESQAEKNAAKLEAAQYKLAAAVDYNTGKIRENNAAKLQGIEVEARSAMNTERINFIKAQKTFRGAIAGGQVDYRTGTVRDPIRNSVTKLTPGQIQAYRMRDQVLAGKMSETQFTTSLGNLSKTDKSVRGISDNVSKLYSNLNNQAETYLEIYGQYGLATGQNTPANRRYANKDFSGGSPAGGGARSLADLNAAAEAESKRLGDRRYSAGKSRDSDLAELEGKRGKMDQEEYIAARAKILRTYDAEIESIGKADAAAGRKASRAAAAEQRREAAAAKRAANEAQREADEAARNKAQETMDTKMQDLEERSALMSRAQYNAERIQILETYDASINAIKSTSKESDKAARQRISDARAIAAAQRDIEQSYLRQHEMNRLLAEGREDEAAALNEIYRLIDAGKEVTERDYEAALKRAQVLRQDNEILRERSRITDNLRNITEDARSTLNNFFMELGRGKPVNAFKSLFRDLQENFLKARVTEITNRILSGTDSKMEALIRGKSNVDIAVAQVASGLGKTTTSANQLTSAFDRLRQAVDASGLSETTANGVGQAAGSTADSIGRSIGAAMLSIGGNGLGSVLSSVSQSIQTLARDIGSKSAANDNADEEVELVVTATRDKPEASAKKQPSVKDGFNMIGESVGKELDKIFGSRFFSKMGAELGSVMEGVAVGQTASGLAKALGIKQSKTGASIGGAVGGMAAAAVGLPPIVGQIIGGFIGGTIGGLFKKTKTGTATIGATEFGTFGVSGTAGNSQSRKDAAEGSAGTVVSSVERIADSLFGAIDPTRGSVSIGIRNKKYVVDPTGQGRTKGAGVLKFDDESAAIQAAMKNLIEDGIITGISQASQNILKAGKDLELAITKASIIESIPRRLMQIKDPVRYAVDNINREFIRMIGYLKEGGATAQQFAEAQELYDLERAKAVEEAKNSVVSIIQDFLTEMSGGSSSPLRKRTIYENARSDLSGFVSDINNGKTVDQSKLIEAARNFQDASRNLYGSSQDFFTDFKFLFDLLSKARDNAGITNVTDLPASPFATDTTIQQRIAELTSGTNTAITDQTAVIQAGLALVASEVRTLRDYVGLGGGTRDAIELLPGFAIG